MRIINFGSCNIDYVYFLDHIVKPGETQATYTLETFAGGKGLNQSIAAARAGAVIVHAGCVGEDGGFLKDLLAQSGADVSYLKQLSSKNGHAIIQVAKGGENSIFLYPGSNEMLTEAYIDAVFDDFGDEDMVVLQNEVNLIAYIIEKAHQKGMRILLNPSPCNANIKQLDLHRLSHIILNEVESEYISGCKNPHEVIEFFAAQYPNLTVILTLGAKGCLFSDRNGVVYQPAYDTEVVDTTGAGDTFTGYFVAGMAKQEAVADILKKAAAAAAIAVSRKGAAPSVPTHDEVVSALKTLKSKTSGYKEEVLVTKIEQYFDNHIKTATLAELATVLGYSAVYTGTLMKKLFGESFTGYLQQKRCALAVEYLTKADLSVEEIAEIVGYRNKTFFRKVFRERYGKNPLEFRKGS